MKLINRNLYLDKLISIQNIPDIKIIAQAINCSDAPLNLGH